MKKVFISSTYVDLIEYRETAIKVVNHYKCTPLAMEFFDSLPQDPTTVCQKEIRECDIFIGIYAHRYGFVPKGQEKSITRMEYELATDLGKDCLCFIVNEKFPWEPGLIEFEKRKELTPFLDIVKEKETVSFFTTSQDFETKLTASLGKLIAAGKGKETTGTPGTCIPFAPLPYLAHPYALPQHFTGRVAEMAVLSNWFHNESEPLLVLEAIGGMGKSALSWAWLQKHILAPAVETDGVFWWSFYDEPFDSFIRHLACYVMGDRGKGAEESIDMAALTAALQQRRFLLVLDGLERVLRGYAGMEGMFIQENRFAGDEEAEAQCERRMREPVHPLAARFFQSLCGGKTRTLITTRLMPVPLEGLAGVKRVNLTGLSSGDTVRFLRGAGIKGTRAEMEEAGRVYDFHPLMLTLLAASITRGRTRDIARAFSTDIIDREQPHKILSTAFDLVSEEERRVVTRAAAFRGVFTVEAVGALLPGMDEEKLWEVLRGCQRMGFLFYDESADRFDFHPIMRSFLYRRLVTEGGTEVHTLAVEYFQSLPKPEKVVTLEDLAPVIELYHHLVKAGKFDEAEQLFYGRMHNPCYYQLSAYHLIIELLQPLFPGGDRANGLPRLEKKSAQAWTLNELANTYALSGRPAKAVPLYLIASSFPEKNDNKKNLAVGLGNVAQQQFIIGQLSASTAHLRKSIALCREIKDE
ncbi:MAG: DUF4062 domain-containing protein, partial [bacterium]|nr:DUF4062 domain-containing protein [bacterium]